MKPTMSGPVVIDFASIRTRRGDYLGRLRLDRRSPITDQGGRGARRGPNGGSPVFTRQAVPPAPPREFFAHDRIVERATGRRGLIREVIGKDHYIVMFYQGRKHMPWNASKWGYELAPDSSPTPNDLDLSAQPTPAA